MQADLSIVCATNFISFSGHWTQYTVMKNFGVLLPKHSGKKKHYGSFDMLNYTRNIVVSTRNFGCSFQNFRISSRSFEFSTRNFVFSNRPTETSGVNSGIFCYRNFRSAGNRRNSRSLRRKWVTHCLDYNSLDSKARHSLDSKICNFTHDIAWTT
jgi:hypothetical protein